MTEEYRQGDEFKTGILSAGAKRFKLEGKRQGREAYADTGEDESRLTEERQRSSISFMPTEPVRGISA